VVAAVSAAMAVTTAEPTAFPGNFANPVAVLRRDGVNEGLANVTLPVAAAVAAG